MNPTRLFRLSGLEMFRLNETCGIHTVELHGMEAFLSRFGLWPVDVLSVRRFVDSDEYLIFYKRKEAKTMRILELGSEGSVNPVLQIQVTDEKGVGGANHEYQIVRKHEDMPDETYCQISFQNGAIHEAGINGITNETLLAIVIDRLEGFASGQFSNEYTVRALAHCNSALEELQERTRERESRGVEGKHVA